MGGKPWRSQTRLTEEAVSGGADLADGVERLASFISVQKGHNTGTLRSERLIDNPELYARDPDRARKIIEEDLGSRSSGS